uniref:Uncharacterized protein n=1 Tax=Arundo donax TaxID=35708 RepID=A0A0A9A5Y5_ARUDO
MYPILSFFCIFNIRSQYQVS